MKKIIYLLIFGLILSNCVNATDNSSNLSEIAYLDENNEKNLTETVINETPDETIEEDTIPGGG